MKSLVEINQNYGSDKGKTNGRGHSYLDFYESLFNNYRNQPINLLEIGVLFGNSLKLWSDFFTNGSIYGVEDFSQKDGQQFYYSKPVIYEEIVRDLSKFNRVKLFVFDCENVNEIQKNLSNMEFDIIIDDASHALNQQLNNYTNYHKFLKVGGIYVCEDVQNREEANQLGKHMVTTTPNREVSMVEFDVKNREDDRIIFIK
jgi:cephalosporin hydroxylase